MKARLCPHCGVMSKFDDQADIKGSWGRDPERLGIALEIKKCQNCSGLIVTVRSVTGDDSEFISYPQVVPVVDSAIPAMVRADYLEGVECLGISKYKAAAAMFRRTLQCILLDRGAPASKRLVQQINDLADQGKIPVELAAWAHEIRLWGNDGAHPSTDGLDELTREEVQEVQDFLDRIFEWLYIMPARLTRSKEMRAAKKV